MLRFSLALTAVLLPATIASAQDAPSLPRQLGAWLSKAMQAANQPVKPDQARRDPTEAQGELRKLLNAEPPRKEGAPAAPPTPVIPPITLRGVVANEDGSSVVLVAIGDRTYTMRPGREYYVTAGAQPITLKVIGVDTDGVAVQLQPFNKQMILP